MKITTHSINENGLNQIHAQLVGSGKVGAKYINFFPGDTRSARSLTIDDEPAYGVYDITDMVDSVATGIGAVSCSIDGSLDALEDGSLWADDHQEALEDLHALIKGAQ